MASIRQKGSALGCVVALALAAAGCGGSDSSAGSTDGGNVVSIGVNESLSGASAVYGLPNAVGARLAIKRINAAGGFEVAGKTYKLKVVEVDNRSDAAAAVAGATKLAGDEGIKFIFGPTLSTLAEQTKKITVARKVLQFSAAGIWQTNGDLSDPKKPYLFGTQPALDSVAKLAAEGVISLGASNVGSLNQDDDTTEANVPPILANVRDAGIKVEDVRFSATTTDFTPYLLKLKNAGAQALYYYLPANLAGKVLDQAVELGVAPKGIAASNIDPSVGKDWSVPFVTTLSTPSIAYPATDAQKKLSAEVIAAYPDLGASSNFVYYSYDFVGMLTQAMSEAGSVTDVDAISKALRKLSYDGVAGKVCYQSDARVPDYGKTQITVKDGKMEPKAVQGSC